MGAARTKREERPGRARGEARVAALLARHTPALMRVARHASLCEDDALDALQRALEIYVRRLDTVDVATEAAWLKVVIRHEAYAIRRSRDAVATPDLDLDAVVPSLDRSVEERVLSGDRVSRSAQALRALKPDEARALMLKAHGLSYDEIGRHCGWTYTKVNRCITEGRRRFLEAYAELEDGTACVRFAPAVAALAAGTATSQQVLELRPHLRACAACRASVRDLHMSGLRKLRVIGPIPALGWFLEKVTRHAPPPHVVPPRVERIHPIVRVKTDIQRFMGRMGQSDVGTGLQIAAASGGGRIATVGAIVGLCLSGLGAGTVCVVRGVSPLVWLHAHPAAPTPKRAAPRAHPTVAAATHRDAPIVVKRAVTTPTPNPTPASRARRQAPTRRRASEGSQGRRPTSHESAPISPAPPTVITSAAEFSPAPAGGTGSTAPPAAAPATGGSEFGP